MQGITKIELTDVHTGKKEVIRKHNMITNAVADALQMNPFAAGLRYYDSTGFAGRMIPLAGNAIGGIQLFTDALTENVNSYYAPYDNDVIGYADMAVNGGTDPRRGSLNQLESGALAYRQGYRFVWDFTTSQGNGFISAIGLTHRLGGQNSAGNHFVNDSSLNLIYRGQVNDGDWARRRTIMNIISLDGANNCAYSVYLEDSYMIRIKKVKFPVSSFGLTQNLAITNEDIEDVQILTPEAFGYVAASTGIGYAYLSFCDDGAGYIWGFQHNGNAQGNSSGNATIKWIKINKTDWTFTEGSWEVAAQIYQFGTHYMSGSYAGGSTNCIIHHGHLYCLRQSLYGVYCINVNNPTDVELLPEVGLSGSYYYKRIPDQDGSYTFFNLVGDSIIMPCGHIVNDVVYNTYVSSTPYRNGLSYATHPKLQYGPFLLTFDSYSYNSNQKNRISVYLMTPYLATINNLANPVEKTADKTMKITYTLYEGTVPEPDDDEDETPSS